MWETEGALTDAGTDLFWLADDGDALALTFAWPVFKMDWAEERRIEEKLQRLKRYVV